MEVDKENVCKTKIPLPKKPLPALPKYLLEQNQKTQKQDNIPPRIPLKTINGQIWPIAGPSKAINKPAFVMKVDTRHVTLRRDYEVSEDVPLDRNSSIISISDDESCVDKENQQYFVDNRKKSDLGNVLSAVTPSLEPSRVKNIKRSLKRPHSRELQGLSPIVTKKDKVDEKAKRRLQFGESSQGRAESPDFWRKIYMERLNRDYTYDILDWLLTVEAKPLDVPRTSSIARACVINWLMKVNGAHGNPATIQSACWYLDSILGTGYVQLDKLQLVAAACYWIAQKFHGPATSAARLVNCSNKAFTTDKLLNAEKVVLIKLKFPPQPVLVQDFINYLSWFTDQCYEGEVKQAATFLYMCGLMVDKLLCDEYPSVIAAAAVRNALLLLGKKQQMRRLLMSNIYKTAEKKATKLSFTCSVLRRAVRTVAAPVYEYKTPLEHYGTAPSFIAQRIITAANELTLLDTRNTERKN
ncbi:cyclin-A2-like [Anticarsia gemmatalis]|uniref:cyclin-A2-like n=1 Tax=Anticarsia gemmatalis TaxID=129554 RepID=UPI003F76703F